MMMFSQMASDHEIASDGRCVWVNSKSGTCIGRFARAGIDIHHDHESQLRNGKQCLDCKKGPCGLADWEYFRIGMRLHFGVEIDDMHMPHFLKPAREAA